MGQIPAASEEMIGILRHLTTTPGLGGKLRSRVEDFVVEEILADGALVRVGSGLDDYLKRDVPGGRYCHFALEKHGIDLFKAIRQLSSDLGISRKRFAYSGTKDAKALTCQLISLENAEPLDIRTRSRRIRIYTPYRACRGLHVGDHWGNAFTIKISGISLPPSEVDEVAGATAGQIACWGGVPNFYGHQRFGTLRANTHIVGRHLVAADFESAVRECLCTSFQGEDVRTASSRKRLSEEGDFKAALGYFPVRLSYERAMLDHLSQHPKDFLGALRRIPAGLLSLYMRAYQAYIFNLTLSRRIGSDEPFVPREGDVLQTGAARLIVGEGISCEEADRLFTNGEARVVYSVVGYASQSEGPVSAEILRTMESEGVTASSFYVRQIPDLSPRGDYRDLLCPVLDLRMPPAERSGSATSLELSFRLRKGSYATVVLREFMKAGIESY